MTTPFGEAPRPPVTCPRCGRLFEVPFKVGGKLIKGHQTGDPKTCIPPTGSILERDARRRPHVRNA